MLDDLLLLNQLWLDRRLATADAARLIQKPEAEARGRLQRLSEAGLAESRREGRGRTWNLAASTYRRLGEKAAYVRQRGFEPLQQEQMVLQYVEKHGSISRGEVADLCKLSPPQAYRILQAIVKKGFLQKPPGRGRGVRYERKAQ